MDGCPSDIRLRPGLRPKAEILFTCPVSPDPIVILRGRGHNKLDETKWYRQDFNDASQGLAHRLLKFSRYPRPARPDVQLPVPTPPCTTHDSGFTVDVYDYRDVDTVVDGLLSWLEGDDLYAEIVVRIVPNAECGVHLL